MDIFDEATRILQVKVVTKMEGESKEDEYETLDYLCIDDDKEYVLLLKALDIGKLYKRLSELHRTSYINATNNEITSLRRSEAQKAVFDEINKIIAEIKRLEK